MKRLLSILCLPLFILSCRSREHNANTDTTLTVTTIDSGNLVSKDSANKMITSFVNSTTSLPGTNAYSFSFDAATLRDYLNSASDITRVKISFAHTLKYINSGNGNIPAGYQSGALTLIISAYDATGSYKFLDNEVMNYAQPCPNNCPPGEAASPNFPL